MPRRMFEIIEYKCKAKKEMIHSEELLFVEQLKSPDFSTWFPLPTALSILVCSFDIKPVTIESFYVVAVILNTETFIYCK